MADFGSDSAVDSNLLCTETFDFCCDDDFGYFDIGTHQIDNQNVEFTEMPFPFQSEESIISMFEREKELFPKNDYLYKLRNEDFYSSARENALDWIWKAQAHYNFGALSVCLAINYFDRYLSVYEIATGQPWPNLLLSVVCLSLAAKFEEIDVPLIVDLQMGNLKLLFEGKTIKTMELRVLSTLNWRMQACTPCSFIDYFLWKINSDILPSGYLITRSIQFILSTIRDIDFLEFKPSEIAAAIAIYVSGEIRKIDIDKAISSVIHVEKDRVLKCFGMVQGLTLVNDTTNGSTTGAQSVAQSPILVLDSEWWLSYKRTVGSSPNSSPSPDIKRTRVDSKPSQWELDLLKCHETLKLNPSTKSPVN